MADSERTVAELTKKVQDLRSRLRRMEEETKRHAQAEATLRLQSRVLESMAEGVSVIDETGTIRFSNPAQDAMLGYAPGGLAGRPFAELTAVAPADREALVRHVWERLAADGEWTGEFTNRKRDGTAFTTLAHVTVLEMGGH